MQHIIRNFSYFNLFSSFFKTLTVSKKTVQKYSRCYKLSYNHYSFTELMFTVVTHKNHIICTKQLWISIAYYLTSFSNFTAWKCLCTNNKESSVTVSITRLWLRKWNTCRVKDQQNNLLRGDVLRHRNETVYEGLGDTPAHFVCQFRPTRYC